MDWIVPVSIDERARGYMRSEKATAVHGALRAHGVALLRGAFAEGLIDRLYSEYLERYGGLSAEEMTERAREPAPNPFFNVGERRWDVTPRIDGPFADPGVLANPLLHSFLPLVLGNNLRLSAFTIVASYPGSAMQSIHRDSPVLFPEAKATEALPPYSIVVSLPLIDVDRETGPTGFWLGSHKWAAADLPEYDTVTAAPLRRGDCLLYDYRTLHVGLPNQSRGVRPVLYMAFTRRWYFDEMNYENRTPLDMPLETYLGFPESIRPMLFRVYSQAMHARHLAATMPRWPANPTR
jgi:hypothetical protein